MRKALPIRKKVTNPPRVQPSSVKKSVARVPTYQQGFEMNQFGWYHATFESLTIASLLSATSNVAQDAEEIEITF
jgi:hypothetical protein